MISVWIVFWFGHYMGFDNWAWWILPYGDVYP